MDLAQLTRAVQRLQDMEDVKALKYRYLRCVDTGNVDDFWNVLHPDVIIDFVRGSYRIQTQGAERFIKLMRNVMHGGIVAQHSGHHPDITVVSETEATSL